MRTEREAVCQERHRSEGKKKSWLIKSKIVDARVNGMLADAERNARKLKVRVMPLAG